MPAYKNKEWLENEYVKKELSAETIAKSCNVNSQTILNWLAKFEIPRRDKSVNGRDKRKQKHPTNCTNCGATFYVDMPSKADPNNQRKFVRACSPECTSALKSRNMKNSHNKGKLRRLETISTKLDKDEIVQMVCYEHMYLTDVAKELKVKQSTLSREIERLGITIEFYRNCPQCGEQFASKMRCQVDENSNKFRKFCGRRCFLKSRRNTDTWIERVTEEVLMENGIEFVKQFEVGRMTADFYIPTANLIVETNGDFWHANPEVYPDRDNLHPIQRRAVEKDKRKLQQLHDLGYEVYVIWEHDLSERKQDTLQALLEHIRQSVEQGGNANGEIPITV